MFLLTPALPFTDFVSRIPSSVLNTWRTNISQAVDGINGGTYTLLSPIVFAGAGIQVTGPLVADDIAGHVKTGKTLTVDSGGTFITVSGATFTIGSAATFNGDASASGAWTWTGAHTKSGSGATVRQRTATVPAVNSTITTSADVHKCGTPLTNLAHTVADASDEGIQVTIWRTSAGAFDIVLKRADTSVIATLPTATQAAVTLTFYASGGWEVTGGYAFT